ncbi:hypothetical protein Tco_0371853 [Tanacetum coccineum]
MPTLRQVFRIVGDLITMNWIPDQRDQHVHNFVGIMEMELDIENMTLNEYLDYEAEKERQLRRTFDYPYYHEDIEIDKNHDLPPLHPCFQPQPYTKAGLVSPNKIDGVDIDSMTIAEYELYVAKQEEVCNDLFRLEAKNLRGTKQEEDQMEDCDEGDMDKIWDITAEDVKRLRIKEYGKDQKRKGNPSNMIMVVKEGPRRELKKEFNKEQPSAAHF